MPPSAAQYLRACAAEQMEVEIKLSLPDKAAHAKVLEVTHLPQSFRKRFCLRSGHGGGGGG